ncbi:unnamed protein product [Calypogeia fissa]
MEVKGTKEALERLRDNNIILKEIIHDDNKFVDAIIEELEILNQKDLWHKAKNLVKIFVEKLVNQTFTLSVDIDQATTRSQLQAAIAKGLKEWLKAKNVKGLSKLKKIDLIYEEFTI